MKRFLTLLIAFAATAFCVMAQNALNDKADSVLGEYLAVQKGEEYKVRITKKTDGTFKAQIFWLKEPLDAKTGQKKLDTKNPDKSLRSVPSDQVVLIDGFRYNSAGHCWDGAKIYDPQRGIKANATLSFDSKGRLTVSGSVLGIKETAVWTKQ